MTTEKSYTEYCDIYDGYSKLDSKLPTFKLAVLRNCTVEPLIPLLKAEIILAGYNPEVYICQYDGVAADALNSSSEFYKFQPDLVLVFQWLPGLSKKLTSQFFQFSELNLNEEVNRVVDSNTAICSEIRRNSGAPIIFNNFADAPYHTLGILDGQASNWQTHKIASLNLTMLEAFNKIRDTYILDVNKIIYKFGIKSILSERDWHIAKLPFSRMGLVQFASEFGKFIRAITGKQKKCLILDCDNTIWGGILGEDGIDGIRCDENYPGSCYLSLQEEILNLHARGVIIALCSKNNERDVMDALEIHKGIILKKKHLAAWRINWRTKAENIQEIASELNIGLDSMVFMDDSEFEIGLVRSSLPEVATISLKNINPSQYRSALLEAGYFDSLSFTNEDRNKTQAYKDNSKRENFRKNAPTFEEYLETLSIEVNISLAEPEDYARCAQLTQKTNQFNLTTKRYTESKLGELFKNGSRIYRIKARDCVSDLGIIGMSIVIDEKNYAKIDTFLMSCRALGRGIENAFLAYIIEAEFSKNKINGLIGVYTKSPKNSQVKEFYSTSKFSYLNENIETSTIIYFLKNSDAHPEIPKWITLNE